MRYVITPDPNASTQAVGGKGANLAAAAGIDVLIPPWFAVSPDAFKESLGEGKWHRLSAARDWREAMEILGGLEPCAGLSDEMGRCLASLCPHGEHMAVRSSAVDEDGIEHSGAGQLESFLSVPVEQVIGRVADVWRSAYSERVYAYRKANGMSLPPSPPAVLVQHMVDATASGVAFSADPVSDRDDLCIVTAVPGLASALVSGAVDADTYYVDREGLVTHQDIAIKKSVQRPAPGEAGGVVGIPVPDRQARKAVLSEQEAASVADLARRAASRFGRPQDIEWALKNGRLYLLQTRPVTGSARTKGAQGVLNIWDNANIAESYSGVTTPLTFTFARRAYEEVYRRLCHTLGIPKAAIAAHDDTFSRMLGLIQGRIYYNLLSWYRILALLPGFSSNRRYMEQMMGVDRSLSEAVRVDGPPSSATARFKDGIRLASTGCGLVVNHFLLPSRKRRFLERLDRALAATDPPLEEMPPDALGAHYRDLERQLLARWDAPLITDLFAMIFFGVLRKLTVSWCGDHGTGLHNDLLGGEKGMVSVEPARRLRTMAGIARQDPAFVALLTEASSETVFAAMRRVPEFERHYQDYLDAFGDRCLDELKLESPTLLDDPTSLLRAVGRIARSIGDDENDPRPADATVRQKAEQRAMDALARSPVKRLFFRWVLRHARSLVRDRENLRFERTRVFGRARRIFVEFGKRYCDRGLLKEPQDIFYLEVEEILGLVEGTASTTRLRDLVEIRRSEFDAYAGSEAPPNRFETRGMVSGTAFRQAPRDPCGEPPGDVLQGLGAAAGTVRGPARMITDPRTADMAPGDILVAGRTDPGWIMLFTGAAGVLVERGSLLSHASIVARELGIPTVVSLPGLMNWLKDGDLVEVDGTGGTVRRIATPGQVPDAK